jgi:capsular exopolysaccharide synthesis family protein
MSKYFNETIRARNAVLVQRAPGQSESNGEQKTASVSNATVPEPPRQPLESCETISFPLTELLRDHFRGSDSLVSIQEAYRGLRTRLLRLQSAQGLRSIIITSSVQGEGKTLTSFNLALCCAQLEDTRTLLIDADIRSCGLSRLVGSPSGPGLADVLEGKCEPEKAILATSSRNLYVMTSGAPSMPSAELLASARWPELIRWCNDSFRLVLVDSPPVLNLADVELISAGCDGIVMVVRAQHTKRAVLEKSVGRLDSKKLIGLVYNATDSTSHEYKYPYVGSGD